MNRIEYEAAKKKGELIADAELNADEIEVEDKEEIEEDTEDETLDELEIENSEIEESEEEDDLPPLNEKEKTAFEKRLEREKLKFEEKRLKEIEEQYELKYNKHKQVIESMGGDPDKILEAAKNAALENEANALANQNAWTPEEKTWFIGQRKAEIELKELRVQMQINKLKDNPDYSGIAKMEKEILATIDRTGGNLTAEEAYWALGGAKRAEQIKLEATMREVEKRKKTPRTVITDAQTSNTAEKPLPNDVLKDMQKLGISAEEAKRLMSKESPKTLSEYRKNKSK